MITINPLEDNPLTSANPPGETIIQMGHVGTDTSERRPENPWTGKLTVLLTSLQDRHAGVTTVTRPLEAHQSTRGAIIIMIRPVMICRLLTHMQSTAPPNMTMVILHKSSRLSAISELGMMWNWLEDTREIMTADLISTKTILPVSTKICL